MGLPTALYLLSFCFTTKTRPIGLDTVETVGFKVTRCQMMARWWLVEQQQIFTTVTDLLTDWLNLRNNYGVNNALAAESLRNACLGRLQGFTTNNCLDVVMNQSQIRASWEYLVIFIGQIFSYLTFKNTFMFVKCQFIKVKTRFSTILFN